MALAKPDDFEDGSLDAVWSFLDPLGDCSFEESGGALRITVPAGTIHDQHTTNTNAPKIRQSIDDTDFDLRVHISSDPTAPSPANFRDQGMLVTDLSQTNRIRVSVYGNSSGQRLVFVAHYNGTTATTIFNSNISPQQTWLRLVRTGSTFQAYTGTDGVNWTTRGSSFSKTITVAYVGLYAGNASTAPEHTAVFEAFENPDFSAGGEAASHQDGAEAGESMVAAATRFTTASDGAKAGDAWAGESSDPNDVSASDGARAGDSYAVSVSYLRSISEGAKASDSTGGATPRVFFFDLLETYEGTAETTEVEQPSGDLVTKTSDRFWKDDSARFWSGVDSALFYSAVYFTGLHYFQLTPPARAVPANLSFEWNDPGVQAFLEYRRVESSAPFWQTSDDLLFWYRDDADQFWLDGGTRDDFVAFPGGLDVTRQIYEFRLTMQGGRTQGRISQFDAVYDVPDLVERFNDLSVPSGGMRISLARDFRKIIGVRYSIQDGPGTLVLLDKDVDRGPLIQVQNDAGTGIARIVDLDVIGY